MYYCSDCVWCESRSVPAISSLLPKQTGGTMVSSNVPKWKKIHFYRYVFKIISKGVYTKVFYILSLSRKLKLLITRNLIGLRVSWQNIMTKSPKTHENQWDLMLSQYFIGALSAQNISPIVSLQKTSINSCHFFTLWCVVCSSDTSSGQKWCLRYAFNVL